MTTLQSTKKATPEQMLAIDAMQEFVKNSTEQFFLLEGFAGTGKTFCVTEYMNRTKSRVLFTAPTNKATRVIRETLRDAGFTPECRTIYSALGLSMSADGEIKELAVPEDPIDLTSFSVIFVDEGSMISKQLWDFMVRVAEMQKLKFIFLADFAQLPPVKELRSPVQLNVTEKAQLTTIMRYDNALLRTATLIRSKVDQLAPSISLVSDNDSIEGVWATSRDDFDKRLLQFVDSGGFASGKVKAVAWRNVTVDKFNEVIRKRIFQQDDLPQWVVGDRLILTQPAKDFENRPVAHTDDEGVVTAVSTSPHPIHTEFNVWRLTVTLDTNTVIRLRTLHPNSAAAFERKKEELSAIAKLDRRKWKDFWKFIEDFHYTRHAYALTAHRSQGSTYDTVFVDWRDILINRNRQEAFRCLYVACTRAKTNLFLA